MLHEKKHMYTILVLHVGKHDFYLLLSWHLFFAFIHFYVFWIYHFIYKYCVLQAFEEPYALKLSVLLISL